QGGASARLCGRCAHSLAGRILPPGHRLARDRARKISKISRLALRLTKRYQEEKNGGEEHGRKRPPEHLYGHQRGCRTAAVRSRPPGVVSARPRGRLRRPDCRPAI